MRPGEAGGEVGEQGNNKTDIVNGIGPGVAAAGAGVPGQEPAAEAPGTIRVNGEKSLAIGNRVEASPLFLTLRRASTTVEIQDHCQGLVIDCLRRDMEKICADAAGICEVEIIVTWSEIFGIRGVYSSGASQRTQPEYSSENFPDPGSLPQLHPFMVFDKRIR